jgi:hypothetical protein
MTSAVATVVGIAVALFGASGVFGQLQDALNTIWGVKPKPGRSFVSFLRARFLSFAMVAGVCFLLLVSPDGIGRSHRCRWIPRARSSRRQRTGVDYPFSARYQHCYAALRDDLQISTRRETLLARCAARSGTNGRVIFGRQIRSWSAAA